MGFIRAGYVLVTSGQGVNSEDIIEPRVERRRRRGCNLHVRPPDPFIARQPVEGARIHREVEARGDLALEIAHCQVPRAEHVAEPRVYHDTHSAILLVF